MDSVPAESVVTFDVREMEAKAPTCTHLMLFCPKEDRCEAIFRFLPSQVKGKRSVLDVFIQHRIKNFPGLSFHIDILAMDDSPIVGADLGIIWTEYARQKINLPCAIEMLTFFDWPDYVSLITLIWSPERTTISYLSRKHILERFDEVHDFAKSLSILSDPLFFLPYHERAVSMADILSKWDSNDGYVHLKNNPADRKFSNIIRIHFLRHRRPPAKLFLSVVLGPLYEEIGEIILNRNAFALQATLLFFDDAQEQRTWSKLKRLYSHSASYLQVAIFRHEGMVPSQTDFRRFELSPPARGDFIAAKQAIDAQDNILSDGSLSRNALAEKVQLSEMMGQGLEEDEKTIKPALRRLGLVSREKVKSPSEIAKLRMKRKLRKLKISLDDTKLDGFNSTSSDSDSDEVEAEIDTEVSLDSFNSLASSIVLSEMAIQKLSVELKILDRICRNCQALLVDRQRRIILEFFLNVKQILSAVVLDDSFVLKDLESKNSFLSNALKKIGNSRVRDVLIRCMRHLVTTRKALVNPKYSGEPLHFVRSKTLRESFSLLVIHDIVKQTVITEGEVVLDISANDAPASFDFDALLKLKQRKEDLEHEVDRLSGQLVQARNDRRSCLAVAKEREHLVIGAVFKKFLRELRQLSKEDNILGDSLDESSPVSLRMRELGLGRKHLKTIMVFNKLYRNEAAHPAIENLNVTGLGKELGQLLEDYDYLKTMLPRIRQAIDASSSK